ncbi:DUF935 domain-containing protein [Pseudomonas aeruginosa]|uniref:DUF935 domain-containing protein n=1 Tax=Pseudomonas aeruginosa TaxID=287 RepID=UPI000FC40CCD|nr:DUF935 domain-containing protein [Pseudomonas aeruginosa]MDA3257885.1 DUF935 family protein [Pseudomonas aeruginosa]MDA3262278.1 DUF935 family protein [Pseudomonas aeruginosa]MDA3293329.1 DUF935 family protein [Pseudomonas aeruginosa]MDA3294749.1 DUF935 family protein [Pseudomonas aeruginosa]MDA3295323.1 DUF935 family protein [Pseudomonas aeruginosa]
MATIVDIYGNPLRTQQLRKQQTAHLAGLAKEFANHPAKGLTPAKLAHILIDAEQGHLQAQAELFMDMEERDAHLFAEMSKRKRAVLGLDWTIEPPRNASAAEKADAEYLHELLLDLEGIEDLMLDCMDGVGHGYSAIELDWSLQGREWLPQAFDHRPQSWFQLSPDDQDELRLRDNSIAGEVLQPFGWIMHKPRSRSGYMARSGLFRVVAWPYLFKHYSTADLAEMLEIYGLPIRLGKYPPGTPDEEKVTLLRAVTGLGHAAAGIIPESMSIDFQEASKGSAEPFMAMMRWCDDSMSKAILGGTLTSQTSESGGGAYALGQVHNEVRHDLLAADARQLAATLSRDLLWPLLVLNRSGNLDARRAPRLVFDLKDRADLAAMATSLPPLVKLGVQVPVNWVQEQLGIPLPAKGEAVLVDQAGAGIAQLSRRPGPRVAALAQVIGPRYRDQEALDQVLASLPAQDMQNQADSLVAPLLDVISRGGSEAELLGALAEAFPDMDDSALADALHRLLFVADTWGRLNGTLDRID